MPRERVIFRNGGLRLVGDLVLPAGQGPSPGVVLCHGLGSRKERHDDFAGFAASRGLAVLAFDMRGHGESEGKLDSLARADVVAALAYLGGRPEVDADRLAVRGSSLGGHFAIHTAAENANVRACVAICPAPEHLLARNLRRAAETGVPMPDFRIDMLDFQNYLRTCSLHRSVGRVSPRPLLLIHSLQDAVVPAGVSRELFDLAGQPKELWLIAGGSHTSAQHDPVLHQRTAAWLLRWLTP